MKFTKKEIREQLYIYTELRSVLKGTLQQVSANVLNLETRLKEEHALVKKNPDSYLRFEMEVRCNEFDSEIILCGIRLETDKEFDDRCKRETVEDNKRKKEAQRMQDLKEERELKIYLKLKEKFEKQK